MGPSPDAGLVGVEGRSAEGRDSPRRFLAIFLPFFFLIPTFFPLYSADMEIDVERSKERERVMGRWRDAEMNGLRALYD